MRVEAILEGLPGFFGADVDVAAGRVTVQFDGAALSTEDLVRRIEGGGYGCSAFGPAVSMGW